MEDPFSRGWHELIARDSGLLHARLLVQPLVASLFAIRSGLRDSKEGRPVFFWTFVGDTLQRRSLLRQLWRDIGKLFVVAAALDLVYQIVVLRWFYPVQTLIVASVVAVVPYLVIRGLTNRLGARFPSAKPRED